MSWTAEWQGKPGGITFATMSQRPTAAMKRRGWRAVLWTAGGWCALVWCFQWLLQLKEEDKIRNYFVTLADVCNDRPAISINPGSALVASLEFLGVDNQCLTKDFYPAEGLAIIESLQASAVLQDRQWQAQTDFFKEMTGWEADGIGSASGPYTRQGSSCCQWWQCWQPWWKWKRSKHEGSSRIKLICVKCSHLPWANASCSSTGFICCCLLHGSCLWAWLWQH